MNILNIIDDIQKVDADAYEKLDSRRSMFGRAGKFAGKVAVAAIPFALGGVFKEAFGKSNDLINDTLNFALTLEYLENEFYIAGLAATSLIPTANKATFQQISKHETAHVKFLTDTIKSLNGTPVPKPTFDFTAKGAYADVFTNFATFLAVSQAFEDTGVRAYKGQAGNLMTNDVVLQAALQIHSVEARHAAQVRRLRMQKGWITGNQTDVTSIAAVYAGDDNTNQGGVTVANTAAFDEPLEMSAVLTIAGQFIVK